MTCVAHEIYLSILKCHGNRADGSNRNAGRRIERWMSGVVICQRSGELGDKKTFVGNFQRLEVSRRAPYLERYRN